MFNHHVIRWTTLGRVALAFGTCVLHTASAWSQEVAPSANTVETQATSALNGDSDSASPTQATSSGEQIETVDDAEKSDRQPGDASTEATASSDLPIAPPTASPSTDEAAIQHKQLPEATPANSKAPGEASITSESSPSTATRGGVNKLDNYISVSNEGWVGLRVTTGLSLHDQKAYDLYTTNNSLRVRGAGVEVDVIRWRSDIAIGLDGEWLYEKAASENVLGGGYDSAYTHHQGRLGAVLRYRGLGFVVPHIRAFGVLAFTKQKLRDTVQDQRYATDYQRTGGGGVALGVTIRTPSVIPVPDFGFPALSLGLRLEASYTAIAGAGFQLSPKSGGANSIPVYGASLGTLPLGGAVFQAAIELRL